MMYLLHYDTTRFFSHGYGNKVLELKAQVCDKVDALHGMLFEEASAHLQPHPLRTGLAVLKPFAILMRDQLLAKIPDFDIDLNMGEYSHMLETTFPPGAYLSLRGSFHAIFVGHAPPASLALALQQPIDMAQRGACSLPELQPDPSSPRQRHLFRQSTRYMDTCSAIVIQRPQVPHRGRAEPEPYLVRIALLQAPWQPSTDSWADMRQHLTGMDFLFDLRHDQSLYCLAHFLAAASGCPRRPLVHFDQSRELAMLLAFILNSKYGAILLAGTRPAIDVAGYPRRPDGEHHAADAGDPAATPGTWSQHAHCVLGPTMGERTLERLVAICPGLPVPDAPTFHGIARSKEPGATPLSAFAYPLILGELYVFYAYLHAVDRTDERVADLWDTVSRRQRQ
ncbi:hypothetical protein, variant [Fonticula alba]|nr:hypothetical protein, variant [Fonticula alba]KCV68071.1 hypothetical protein, variant [Fonticula alba]|eukprot:XP_009497445.1 hypothetical protein, variant [Fonticula alba]